MLDEPTTLLDLRNTRRVAAVVAGLRQQVVLVTHDLELVCRRSTGCSSSTGPGWSPTARRPRRSRFYRDLMDR